MPKSFGSQPKQSGMDGARMAESPAITGNNAHIQSSGEIGTTVTGMYSNPRRRLGHPNAADYTLPQFNSPHKPSPKSKKKQIVESPFPVFWVEILDEAHQMWLPIDPLVTDSIAKPRVFEPPMSDRENNMSYVIAFEDGGNARDVTKRYTKAFNAKTRKIRIESTPKGEKWWKRTMKSYDRGWKSDLDQIEDIELSKAEAREPMPKNIIDFKDHPIYALERHLRRNEVLVATQESGKVAAGRDSKLPGGKKMESVYRRRDVKIARSGDAWYRLGRDIKLGEQPVKTVPAKRRPDEMDIPEEFDERPGTNLYTEDQTELYKPPPIVNGRVPRNTFGNIDVYVSSMVPAGGVHLPCKSHQPYCQTPTKFYRRRVRSCRSPLRYRLRRSTDGV
jgi:xeroderma pigmentosum group C-complementing protein